MSEDPTGGHCTEALTNVPVTCVFVLVIQTVEGGEKDRRLGLSRKQCHLVMWFLPKEHDLVEDGTEELTEITSFSIE